MQADSKPNDGDPWKWLHRTAGVAALLSAALIVVAGAAFMMWPPPGFAPTAANVRDWFAFFQEHKLVGLLDLDLVMVIDNLLAIPVFLALYTVLERVSRSWAAMGAVGGLVGVASYWAVNPAFSMLVLSNRYAESPTVAERAALVASGQTILALYQGTGFNLYMLLAAAAGTTLSIMMLRERTFGRTAAVGGIAGNGLAPGLFLPVVGLFLGFLSLLPLLVWYVLVGRALLRLAEGQPARPAVEDSVTREMVSPASALRT